MPTLLPTNALHAQLAQTLQRRRAELQALLQSANGTAASNDKQPEVQDFKDVAAEDTQAAIDEVAYTHASQELAQVAAALRRVEDGSYGACLDCGEAIDERRLRALPATAYCTACQVIHERPAARR